MKKPVVMDIECYWNYTLVMFKDIGSGKIIEFEKFNDSEINIHNILHILNKYEIVTFNGIKYDMMIIEAIGAGFSNKSIKQVSNYIIVDRLQPWQVRKQCGLARLDVDHIDLIEVAPLGASLKTYAGRLDAPALEDLPIEPNAIIKDSDRKPLRTYCAKDLHDTEILYKFLAKEIDLRRAMGAEYDVDLNSKSDSQIAEAVIKSDLISKFGINPKRPKIETGTSIYYKPPSNLIFNTPECQQVFNLFTKHPLIVGKSGHMAFHPDLKDLTWLDGYNLIGKQNKVKLGYSTYKIGIGGLHSCEKSTRHVTDENYVIREYDVDAYYPRIILFNKLYPKHVGEAFSPIYESIVTRRLKAKAEKNEVVNESLKITINGSFGKFGSKWSWMYSPDLMMQVTITGQLTLLMLIETLELADIPVVSGNTDGIVVKIPKDKLDLIDNIIEDWEFETGYKMGVTNYKSLNSRDVNNYIAVKEKGVKGKGVFADQRDHFYRLRKNPTNYICSEAVRQYLENNIDISETINSCKDITKFVTIRKVNGGAIKDSTALGRCIRWYYGANELGTIKYVTSGNKVPRSDGAVPLMDLPNSFPEDVDINWYITEAKDMLKNVGHKLQ